MQSSKIAEFDQHAPNYTTNMDKWLKVTSATSETYVSKVKADKIIALAASLKERGDNFLCLDVGCGTGRILDMVQQAGYQGVGIDSSPGMIEEKRHFNPVKPLNLMVSDANKLPFENRSFNLAYSVCLFHHLDDASRVKVIHEMKRVTRPGGLILIFEHNPYNPAVQVIVRCCPLDRHARLLSMGLTKSLFRQAKLDLVAEEYILFFPEALKFLSFTERWFRHFPAGAQYVVAGKVPY